MVHLTIQKDIKKRTKMVLLSITAGLIEPLKYFMFYWLSFMFFTFCRFIAFITKGDTSTVTDNCKQILSNCNGSAEHCSEFGNDFRNQSDQMDSLTNCTQYDTLDIVGSVLFSMYAMFVLVLFVKFEIRFIGKRIRQGNIVIAISKDQVLTYKEKLFTLEKILPQDIGGRKYVEALVHNRSTFGSNNALEETIRVQIEQKSSVRIKSTCIYRIHNGKTWIRYNKNNSPKYITDLPSSLIHNPVLTKSIEYTDESEKGSLALKMNEARLFHGSKLGNTLMPLENGWFKWTNANDGKYDKAHFFAESSVHADQKSSLLKSCKGEEGQLVMFIVRVNLGNVKILQDGQVEIRKTDEGMGLDMDREYDTLVVEKKGGRREFWLFQRCQRMCFPEYMITYERV